MAFLYFGEFSHRRFLLFFSVGESAGLKTSSIAWCNPG
jgi:hypothetical protein